MLEAVSKMSILQEFAILFCLFSYFDTLLMD